jgi:hypothetical protein
MSTIDRAAIPELPEDGKFTRTDRHGRQTTYILRRNLLSEFTPPFLDKWKKKAHPVIRRPLETVFERFRRSYERRHRGRRDGLKFSTARAIDYEAFAENDLNAIREARKRQPDPKQVPLMEKARQNGLCELAYNSRAHKKKLSATTSVKVVARTVTKELKGKERTWIQFAHVRHVDSDELKRDPVPDHLISFPDCARQWGIKLARFHAIVRRSKVLLPDVAVAIHSSSGFTAHGKKPTESENRAHKKAHYRPLNYLDRSDFAMLTAAWEEAKSGRLVRDGKVYLSPTRIAEEFILPEGTLPSMTLRNRAAYALSTLGREMRFIDGAWLAEDRNSRRAPKLTRGKCRAPKLRAGRRRRKRKPWTCKLTRGKCWHESDVEVLFDRKKPRPAAASLQETAAARPTSPVEAREVPAAPPTGGNGQRVSIGTYKEPVIIDGESHHWHSPSEWHVIAALAKAGANGLSKDELEQVNANARRTMKTMIARAEWAKVLVMAGKKGGKYRLL